jgi:hypothetical protein
MLFFKLTGYFSKFFVAHESYCKKWKEETIMKDLDKGGIYVAEDIYFYSFAMLVYFEEVERWETVRGKYHVFKKDVK